MSKLRNPDTDLLFQGILKLQTVDEGYRFFTDICTIKELQAMTQRLQVAKQLHPANVQMVGGMGQGGGTEFDDDAHMKPPL